MTKYTKEQEEAIYIEGTNALVSAGAGSGKTFVLSERVLRKVKDGVSVDDLLILTFTNAAAAEMKERIRNNLKKDGNLDEEVLKVDSAYITTFDSFTLSLVKKYHYLKDLPKEINICDASILSLKKSEILEVLFEELYESQDVKFINFIKKYFVKNDRLLFDFILNLHKNLDLIYEKNEYLDSYFDVYFSDEKIGEFIQEYLDLINKNIDDVKDLYHILVLYDDEYAKKIEVTSLFSASSYEDIKNNLDIDIPRVPKNSDEEISRCKKNISEILDRLWELCKYESLDEIKGEYLSNKEYIEVIIDIVKEFDKRVNDFKMHENVFDFIDIEKLAIDILKENEDVRLFYKNKFNEILIDEYQDTSDIQEYFTDLIANNNVYMVGDIKQSIYRFRNANPDIFKDKFINYGNLNGGTRIDLNKNFRSREEVLSDINLMFDKIMDIPLGGADYKKEHRLIFGNLDYNDKYSNNQNNNFEVYNYKVEKGSIYTAEEIEIFKIALDIKSKINGKYIIFDKDEKINREAKYSDFAILLDRGSSFSLYKKIFEYLKIPLSIFKDESIKSSDIIKIIKNIFVLINKISTNTIDNNFKYSYLSVGRSFISDENDESLYNIITSNKYYDTNIYQLCKSIANNIDTKNIYVILQEVIDKFNFYDRLISNKNIDNNNVVLEYLINVSKNASKIYTTSEFIIYLENIINGSLDLKYNLSKDEDESVTIMTIHKSKGLEFPICYFAGLSKSFNILELSDRFLYSKKYGIIMPVFKDGLTTLFTKVLYREDYIKDEISEKLRLLYVALTRAKEKMIFVMNLANEKDYSLSGDVINNTDRFKYRSFNHILESINKYILPFTSDIDLESLNLTKDYNFSKKTDVSKIIKNNNITLDVKEYVCDNTVLDKKHFSKESKEIIDNEIKGYITEGLYVHKIMEDLDFSNPNLNVIDKYRVQVKNFLDLEILKNYVNIYKEYEFYYYKDNNEIHGIIDLLLEYENKFIIIDYKLKDINNDAYIKQLNGYREYIENITKKICKIYLYSFLDGKLLEL